MTTEHDGGAGRKRPPDDVYASTCVSPRAAFADRSATDYANALISLYRSGADAPRSGWPGSLDVVFEQLALELRLFSGALEQTAADSDEPPHLVVDQDFRVRRRIGSGGMGSVYLAWSESLQRDVALKVPHTGFEGSQQEHRLLREARCLARVRHANVVHVYQIKADAAWQVVRHPDDPGPLQSGRTAVIVMEYFEGETVEAWLQTGRPWREVVGVFQQAARGLAAAHGRGLLHSDITLRNILIDRHGAAKLIDFGLSKPQTEGSSTHGDASPWAPVLTVEEVSGTPGYAAPEQLQKGNLVDARSDLFSLGVSLWRALSGSLPYTATALTPGTEPGLDPRSMLMRESWPRALPGWLRDLLERCLDFERKARPASMVHFLRALEAGLTPPPIGLLRWFAGAFLLALGASIVATVLLTDRAPVPFGADDPGMELVWNAERHRSVGLAIAGSSPELGRAWPELYGDILAFTTGWTETRDKIRQTLRQDWPEELQRKAGLCLIEKRLDFDQVLHAIEHNATRTDTTAPSLMVHRWAVELRPPTACLDPRSMSLGTLIGSRAPDWSAFYTRGYQDFLEHRNGSARYNFQRALEATGSDPVGAARAHHRLALLDLEDSHDRRAQEHLHAALTLAEAGGDLYLQLHVLKQLAQLAATGPDPSAALAHYGSALGKLELWSHGLDSAPLFDEEVSDLHLQAAWTIKKLADLDRFEYCPVRCGGRLSPASCRSRMNDSKQSHVDSAYVCIRDILDLASETAPPGRPQVKVHTTLTEVEIWHGDLVAAERAALTAAELDEALHPPTEMTAQVQRDLAAVQALRGQLPAAEQSTRRALEARDARGEQDGLDAADLARILAVFATNRGDFADACRLAERARSTLERHDMPRPSLGAAIELHELLGMLYAEVPELRDDRLATTILRRGLDLASKAPLDAMNRYYTGQMRMRLGRLALRYGDASQARVLLAAGRHLLDASTHDESAAELLLLSAEADLRLGESASAQEHWRAANTMLGRAANPSEHLALHRDWLEARIRGPRDRRARELAQTVGTALLLTPSLADEILDPRTVQTWQQRTLEP